MRPSAPRLFYDDSSSATAKVSSPLTPALGLQTAARATPHIEGTGALYILESNDSQRIFVLTARHVVLPPNAGPNKLYVRNNGVHQPLRKVLHLGSRAFQNVIESIMAGLASQIIMTEMHNHWLEELAEKVAGCDEDKVLKV